MISNTKAPVQRLKTSLGLAVAALATATLLSGCLERRVRAAPTGLAAIELKGAAAVPFGSHQQHYVADAVLPSLPQQELDESTFKAYRTWKQKYLSERCGGYVVRSSTQAGNLTVSEAHGYGMMLVAYFAGVDPDARKIFDGMVTYYRKHPSKQNHDLMAWYQDTKCQDGEGSDSATDGDVDVAYALLLADRQWGSCGTVNYAGEAKRTLRAIRSATVDRSARWTLLGDWVTPDDAKFYRTTRTSDFVTAEFKSFAALTGDGDWTKLVDSLYKITDQLQVKHAPKTGLLPDFVLDPGSDPRPPQGKLLEGPMDGGYGYNACRDPWRLATDFVVNGDKRAKVAAERISRFFRETSGENPRSIHADYQLDGKATGQYTSLAFVAPLGVAAMVDKTHRRWLDRIWSFTANASQEGYYEDTVGLLSMLVMSGNWWAPEKAAPISCASSAAATSASATPVVSSNAPNSAVAPSDSANPASSAAAPVTSAAARK